MLADVPEFCRWHDDKTSVAPHVLAASTGCLTPDS
jgi:hypothetical protein